NRWQTDGLLAGRIPPVGRSMTVVADSVAEGMLEVKLTRGTWATVACSVDGKLGDPYSLYIDKDMELLITIEAWRDDFPLSTASAQVHILDEQFYFPKMDLRRRVWIYLPEGYASNEQRYPVLYMHDGQHVFDEATAVGRMGPIEWGVDEVIDETVQKAIVVAVDHAPDFKGREQEYLVNPVAEHHEVLGRAYLGDIVTVLKPYVDANYRTLSDRAHTAILGSSLAGLLNVYAGLEYPSVFGAVGIFSPSVWIDRKGLYDWLYLVKQKMQHSETNQFFYLYCGALEVRKQQGKVPVAMAEDMEDLAKSLAEIKSLHIFKNINPQGRHGALYWQREFPEFYAWWQEQINI
ncbi:MAG TPA: alpha/beta hydrolase-fold protein, partial [Sphingobacterium sp.]|nr:alpha/beta hydrolase-fold protein [Sphingobacterium sp.]